MNDKTKELNLLIKELKLKMVPNYIQHKYGFDAKERANQEKWQHFNWSVTTSSGISGANYTTQYRTGISYTTPKDFFKSSKRELNVCIEQGEVRDNANKIIVSAAKPVIRDVLYSLVSDAEGAATSFDSFCAEFGYNNDSIKDREIYKACLKTRNNMLNLVGPDALDRLYVAYQDY